ncbi:ABC transporter permease [Bradyrhizobium septentrionale]|uniref:ABC transporter permease n=1 Tax=Bradyrhizobium septentrionale TaxID=1404411 RepID=UPI001596D24C
MFTVGLIWVLSIFNIFFRDIANLVSPLLLFLMLVSPIGYTDDMIPSRMMPIMVVNPLYYMISIYRDLIHFDRIPVGEARGLRCRIASALHPRLPSASALENPGCRSCLISLSNFTR